MPTLEQAQADCLAAFKSSAPAVTCLWPEPFNEDTPEAAWAFIGTLKTWNEAESQEQPFPKKQYLKDYTYEWHECKTCGRMLVCEKCRRMVISWLARGLELWEMGRERTDCILAGEDLEAAAKHVWRLKFLYEGVRKRNPDWNLPLHKELSYEGDRKLKMFGLPNGSVTQYANGQGKALQGDGTKIITLEEASTYRYLASMVAQAKIITQGSAGTIGGFVNLITNTSASHEWQIVKGNIKGKPHAVRIEDRAL